jgi:hypothetical protein
MNKDRSAEPDLAAIERARERKMPSTSGDGLKHAGAKEQSLSLRVHQLRSFLNDNAVPDDAPVIVGANDPELLRLFGGVKMVVLPMVAVTRSPDSRALVLVVAQWEADPIFVSVSDLREVMASHDPNAVVMVILCPPGTDIARIRWEGGGYMVRVVYEQEVLSFVVRTRLSKGGAPCHHEGTSERVRPRTDVQNARSG